MPAGNAAMTGLSCFPAAAGEQNLSRIFEKFMDVFTECSEVRIWKRAGVFHPSEGAPAGRTNRVGGRRSFAYRPLTPPCVPFGTRRFNQLNK